MTWICDSAACRRRVRDFTWSSTSECLRDCSAPHSSPRQLHHNAVAHFWAPVNQVTMHASRPAFAIPLFDMLLAAGAVPNHSHGFFGPPIVQAVEAGEIEFVRYLINLRVELNRVLVWESDETRLKYTALDVANDRGFAKIALLLASAGAVSASDAAP